MVDFGKKLKSLRQHAGLTQEQLADKPGVTKFTIIYYELALLYPSTNFIVNLAKAFHVTTDYLLCVEKKQQTIDVTGLSDEDIEFLEQAVNRLRKKNIDRGKTCDTER